MTKEEHDYAVALNEFGSDPQDEAEHDILSSLHRRALAVPPAPVARHSTNFSAVLAAVAARGPRCDGCGGWSFVHTQRGRRGNFRKGLVTLCSGCAAEAVADRVAEEFGLNR